MTSEIIYSTQVRGFIHGYRYGNPRHFTTPRSGVTKVYLVGEWPKVADAYRKLGIQVAQGEPPALPPSAPAKQEARPEPSTPKASLSTEGGLSIQDRGFGRFYVVDIASGEIASGPHDSQAAAQDARAAQLAEPQAHPLDRDGDGKPGGSLPAAERIDPGLLKQAKALGVRVDRRWSEDRVRSEIAKAGKAPDNKD